jgi:ATP-dependent DNA helicase RecG
MTTTSHESQHLDRKSIRKVTGSTADYGELAQDCVCFANGAGGTLLIGIEDDADAPPASQRVELALLDRIRKRVGELTVNVQVAPELKRHENGGEYIILTIPRAVGVASTSDGRYFLRVGDTCRPIVGDDVMRLADERPATPWEEMTSHGVARANADVTKAERFCAGLRESDRVKTSVKEKTDDELLEHYGLTEGDLLTNLGVLLVGRTRDRARLGSAPIVQAIKYDDRDAKVAKWSWDDHELSPLELVDAIWNDIPDFRESYEMPDGMLRTKLPAYDELVIRELLVNAFVHRPYTQRGDLYLNLHPDRLEVVNPGRLPIGVTPKNILHTSRRRNDGMARIFHDMKLMEREGSGIDLLFERLLASGRKVPTIREGRGRTRSMSRCRGAWYSRASFVCSWRRIAATSSRSASASRSRSSRRPKGCWRPSSPRSWSFPTPPRCARGSGGSSRGGSSSNPVARAPRATSCRPRSCVKPGLMR